MSDQTKQYIKYFWYSILGAFGFFILLLILIDFGVFGRMPDWEELENPRAALASEVISEDGAIKSRHTFIRSMDMWAQYGIDAVLVDTAGRMQNNVPLMKALAKLVTETQPDLVLFVCEALVGNDGMGLGR